MRRSARSRETDARRKRLLAGGITGIAVTFSFVAANAMWYQPHTHKSPILATRAPLATGSLAAGGAPVPEAAPTRPAASTDGGGQDIAAIIEREAAAMPPERRPAENVVASVQKVMADLGLYGGEIDGMSGPMTRSAIESYRRTIGIAGGGEIDEQLLAKLGLDGQSSVPVPNVRPRDTSEVVTSSTTPPAVDQRVARIQAGLKAFGNDGIEVDGMVGPRTRAAIREFQSLFGLTVSGEPDDELYGKMREIGLTN